MALGGGQFVMSEVTLYWIVGPYRPKNPFAVRNVVSSIQFTQIHTPLHKDETCLSREFPCSSPWGKILNRFVQGNLAHKKTPTPLGTP